MDTQQVSAPSRAPSRDSRGGVPSRVTPSRDVASRDMPSRVMPSGPVPSGVVHINSRHTARFTVVGNHLAQHPGLSLVAIALAVHIQSLPAGARIGVKVLADRFPESEARVAAALRELEAHGYLCRTRERLPNGRVVTRTVSYNQPGKPRTDVSPGVVPPGAVPPAAAPVASAVPVAPAAAAPVPPAVVPAAEQQLRSQPPPQPLPRAGVHGPRPAGVLPQPLVPGPERHRAAIDLLSGLRRDEPVLLAETDVRRLAPAVGPGSNAMPGPTPYALSSPPICPVA